MGILSQLSNKLDTTWPELKDSVQSNSRVNLTGLTDQAKSLVCAYLAGDQDRLVVLVADEIKARSLAGQVRALTDRKVAVLQAGYEDFNDAVAASRDQDIERLTTLQEFLRGEVDILILSCQNLSAWYPNPQTLLGHGLDLAVNNRYDFSALAGRLEELGYERNRLVEGPGQFSLRGDVLDLGLPVAGDLLPIRVSFFDDEVDDIREFDLDSQRSVASLDQIRIPSLRAWTWTREELEAKADKILALGEEAKREASGRGLDYDQALKFLHLAERDAERIKQNLTFYGLNRWLFALVDQPASLFDYFQLAGVQTLVVDELAQINHRLDGFQADRDQRLRQMLENFQILPGVFDQTFTGRQIFQAINRWTGTILALAQIDSSGNGLSGARKVKAKLYPADSYRLQEERLYRDIKTWQAAGYLSLIFTGNDQRKTKLEDFLARSYLADSDKTGYIKPTLVARDFANGFIWQEAGLAVVGSEDVFGRANRVKRSKKKDQGLAIDFFGDLQPGEYVVHDIHGIGLYNGLVTLETGGNKRDYLNISYAGNDQLYLPIDSLDQIQKYVGGEDAKPKLAKMGGSDWGKLKDRARESIKKLAFDLLALYAERQKIKGYQFGPDTNWQQEFEENFPYEPTEDQARAIEEIKRDMESDQVMDRLLCGDVGFGKTEVAFRAMFKAVMAGKQVALIAPTTVLSQQHYESFLQRLGDFPVRTALVNRYCPESKLKEILRKSKRGELDVLIGTHRLLSKDVVFADLGLLIIDEEQRFGVNHKEVIKDRYPNVDVLTLTATPIPRTLHMSLSGIRDVSVLTAGPEDRRPIQTFVLEYEPAVIDEAILREINRSGQVFYLFNDTYKIAEKANELADRLPGARILYAHGKMSSRQMDNTLTDFIEQKADILVCTTIIESGVDMANVNTIIVENADRLGLAQLYQLRGRVGRSSRQAYAYVTYQPDKLLNEAAAKRLAAIRDYTELGSGLKIAMRDLEVRGAGNLLGADQHGHMEAVGYDMYCRMLDESIRELKGEVPDLVRDDPVVDLDVDAVIDRAYVPDEGQRMDLYRKIVQIKDLDDYRDVLDEMIDRYGEPPVESLTLLDISYIRNRAKLLGLDRIKEEGTDVILSFAKDLKPDMESLAAVFGAEEFQGQLFFNAGASPYLTIRNLARDSLATKASIRARSGKTGALTRIDAAKVKSKLNQHLTRKLYRFFALTEEAKKQQAT